jgi:hypothetical protein
VSKPEDGKTANHIRQELLTEQEDQPELSTEYANAIFLAPTLLDLKVIFGETVIFPGRGTNWHTSITIPWQQAKLLQYYLAVIVAAHEMDNGPIKIPVAMVPKDPPPLPVSETVKPELLKYLKFLHEYHHKFVEELK